MKTRNRSPFLLLAAPIALVALSLTAREPGPVAMGTIELEGSTVKRTVSTSAIPTSGPGPSLVGLLINRSGQDFSALTIEVMREDDDDAPPTGGATMVSRPGKHGASRHAGSVARAGGGGVTMNVPFGSGPTDIKPVKNGEDLEYEVSLTGVDGLDVEVRITPSVTSGSVHADLLAMATLSHDADSLTSTLEAPYHAHVSIRIRNVDRNGNNMTALSGEILSSESGIGLSSVNLYYAHGPFAPEGTSISVNGDQFSITGFKELVPGISYDLLVGLTDPPQQSYSLKLTGTF